MNDCIVCVMCETVTEDWVVWGAAYVEEVYYFCSNECLAQWLVLELARSEELSAPR